MMRDSWIHKKLYHVRINAPQVLFYIYSVRAPAYTVIASENLPQLIPLDQGLMYI